MGVGCIGAAALADVGCAAAAFVPLGLVSNTRRPGCVVQYCCAKQWERNAKFELILFHSWGFEARMNSVGKMIAGS